MVETGAAAAGCTRCSRALVRDVAFNPAYRGLPLDRLGAVLIGGAAISVALAADPPVLAYVFAVVALAAGAYALIPRRRRNPRPPSAGPDSHADSTGVGAAAADPSIATRRRPHTPRT